MPPLNGDTERMALFGIEPTGLNPHNAVTTAPYPPRSRVRRCRVRHRPHGGEGGPTPLAAQPPGAEGLGRATSPR